MPEPLHYCFLTLSSWKNNASLMRLHSLGAEMIRKGVRVSYVLDDVPHNRQPDLLPAGAIAQFVSPVTGLAQIKARRRAIESLAPDFVHVLNPSPKSYLALRRLRGPRFVIDWDEWHAIKPRIGWRRRFQYAMIDRWHRKRAALLVVSSRFMQEEFERRFGRRPLYLSYAPYLQPVQAAPSPFDAPTAVYMGTLFPDFDHDIVFSAAEILKSRGVRPRIEFVGAGPELEKWRTFTHEHDLPNVHMSGFLPWPDVWARLVHAHVLLFPIRPNVGNLARCPSKTYAFGQARRPVITCRVGEVPETLGDAATYVDPTPQAFADALQQVISSPRPPDVDYHIEQHNWAARAAALLQALPAK
jgi:glycosyltransferase involved in cell wall biosynthesis